MDDTLITEQINEINRERERAAAAAARYQINTILSIKQQIASLQEQLIEAQKELTSISFSPVTAADVLS